MQEQEKEQYYLAATKAIASTMTTTKMAIAAWVTAVVLAKLCGSENILDFLLWGPDFTFFREANEGIYVAVVATLGFFLERRRVPASSFEAGVKFVIVLYLFAVVITVLHVKTSDPVTLTLLDDRDKIYNMCEYDVGYRFAFGLQQGTIQIDGYHAIGFWIVAFDCGWLGGGRHGNKSTKQRIPKNVGLQNQKNNNNTKKSVVLSLGTTMEEDDVSFFACFR